MIFPCDNAIHVRTFSSTYSADSRRLMTIHIQFSTDNLPITLTSRLVLNRGLVVDTILRPTCSSEEDAVPKLSMIIFTSLSSTEDVMMIGHDVGYRISGGCSCEAAIWTSKLSASDSIIVHIRFRIEPGTHSFIAKNICTVLR